MEDFVVLVCPHCEAGIVVSRRELNCRIFRHGVLRSTMQGIPPHAPKAVCDALAASGQIYGCGKPFRAVDTPDRQSVVAVPCDYI